MDNNVSSGKSLCRDCLPLFLFIGVGFLIFLQNFSSFVAPYYPRYFDQSTQIRDIYQAYYELSNVSWPSTGVPAAISTVLSFKGFLFPLVATALTVLFGPERVAIAAANFVFFSAAIIILFMMVRRSHGRTLAYISVGLFVSSESLYFAAGGLQDLRWDFAGLATFGILVLSSWRLLAEPGRWTLSMTTVTFSVSLCTRFITGIYGLVLIFALVAVCFGLFRATRTEIWRRRLNWSAAAGLVATVIAGLYIALFHSDLSTYYLGHLQTGERELRFAEAGVSGPFGLMRFYLDSFWQHFKFSLMLFLVILVSHLVCTVALRRRSIPSPTLSPARCRDETILPVMVATLSGVAVLTSLSVYSPSHVAIGVLTIPVVMVLSAILSLVQPSIRDARVLSGLSFAAFSLGALNFIYHETVSHPWTVNDLRAGREHNALYETIIRDHPLNGARIAWLAVEDGAIEPVFNVFLYESRLPDLVPRFQHSPFTIFALDTSTILQELQAADVVVAWGHFDEPAGYTYPIIASLQHTEAMWRPVLEREFIRRYGVQVGAGEVDYYTRPLTMESIVAPDGVEHPNRDSRTDDLHVRLGDRPGIITVRNLANAPLPAIFEADVRPIPGSGETGSRTVRIGAAGVDREGVVSEANGWHLALPMTLAPGSTELRLSVVMPAAEHLAGTVNPKTMIAEIRRPRLHLASTPAIAPGVP